MRYVSTVVRGAGRGRALGFPTLNIVMPKALVGRHGIFAGWVWIGTRKYQAAFHIGPAPVFQRKTVTLEAFVINKRITREPAQISFQLVKKLRRVKNFNSPAALVRQMHRDVESARAVLEKQT